MPKNSWFKWISSTNPTYAFQFRPLPSVKRCWNRCHHRRHKRLPWHRQKGRGKSSKRKDMESLGMIALPLPIRCNCKLPEKKKTGRLGDSFIHRIFFGGRLLDTHFELHVFRHFQVPRRFLENNTIYLCVYIVYIYIHV